MKKGDILEFIGDELETKTYIMEVREVLGSLVFTRDVFSDGSVGPTTFNEEDDLKTWGWKKRGIM